MRDLSGGLAVHVIFDLRHWSHEDVAGICDVESLVYDGIGDGVGEWLGEGSGEDIGDVDGAGEGESDGEGEGAGEVGSGN